ncbi:MAG: nicotinate (nicotinamide) nucleotide adenylyltransferase [Chlamydiales bacterium]
MIVVLPKLNAKSKELSKRSIEVGIFGGTFDPVHFGHINIALELKERCQIDEVLIIPTSCSPFRMGESLVAPEHRLQMVRLAFEKIPGFSVLEIEIKKNPPNYTIDTVRDILSHETRNCALMLADDTLQHLPQWKEYKNLLSLLPIVVGRRNTVEPFLPQDIKEKIEKTTFSTSVMEISGTKIRERMRKKLYCGHLVPAKVLDYIYENQLYFDL